jgi:hypothetical protein
MATKGRDRTQVPTALTQAPLTVPIPVAQLTDELEMPVIAKRVRNAGRKEWDCIIQRRALPGLSQDGRQCVQSIYTTKEGISAVCYSSEATRPAVAQYGQCKSGMA